MSAKSNGAAAIETATPAMSRFAISVGRTPFCVANEHKTKANSPPCASAKAKRKRWLGSKRKARASASKTRNFATSKPTTSKAIVPGACAINAKSKLAPTEIKKRPRRSPLKG